MADLKQSPLTLNGIELEVRRQGRGETILLLHGAGGSAGLVPLVEELSEEYEILMPDHPGFGLSGDSKQTTTISFDASSSQGCSRTSRALGSRRVGIGC